MAVLAALLVPVVKSGIEKARETACLSNLKQLYAGFSSYANDHNTCFPFGTETNDAGVITRYVGYFQGDIGREFKAYIPGALAGASTGYCAPYLCPADREFRGGNGPYGYYGHSYGANNVITLDGKNRAVQWVRRADVFLLADALNTFVYRTAPATNLSPRHRQGANTLFCDGHAAWLRAPFPTWSENNRFWDPTLP